MVKLLKIAYLFPADDIHAALEGIETLALKIVDGSGLRGFGMAGGTDSRRHILDGFVFGHSLGHVLVKVGETVETIGVGGHTLDGDR